MHSHFAVAIRFHGVGTTLAVLWSAPLFAQSPAPVQSQVAVVKVKPT